ncbi:hypothetical protein RND81_11G238600 [Saponaria officinalis]|uniref:Uncharacterized protein n=1 Tax=Saponaria officinalis TaxID=3572 RepID=A0AAW1HQ69_SAPOF
MNIKKLKMPKRMRVGTTKLRGMKVSRSIKSIRDMNVAEKLRSFRKRRIPSATTADGGSSSKMGIRRNSTKLIALVKKNIMKPKFPRNKSGSKRNTKNIIIIHNNTSITSNEEDNRSSCVEVKEIASLKEEDVTSIDSAPPTSIDSVVPPLDNRPIPHHEEEKEEEVVEDEEDEDDDEYVDEQDLGIISLREDKASIHIQCVFRGHLARRAFRALKSLVKLQAVVRGVCVRRQARMALHCMNTLARLQVKIRTRQLHCRPSDVVAA